MKKTLLLALSLLPAAADTVSDAAAQLRAGDAAAALNTLETTEGVEAAFWRGRALLDLGRPTQAVGPLQQVPQGHPLFPYAAKALLYCAWQSPEVNPDAVLTPLLDSGNESIRTLVTAALAEYHLNRDVAAGSDTLLTHLHERAAEDESLRPLLNLLEIADLRRKGEFDAAIELCRRLERDRSLPLLTRHRVRLALAEVYYAQEAAHADTTPAPAADEDDDADDAALPEQPVARGRGEETLLHFVSSNPESPLLEEAFRRLMLHEAFLGETARERLKEWGNNMRFPRRAALSLLVQQHLLNPENAPELLPDATCVNAAVAALPKESATDLMLLEQVRLQLQRGNRTEAALYLAGVQVPSPRRDFLAACLIDNPAKAATAFLSIARTAEEELQAPAYHNALLNALKAGDDATVSAILGDRSLPAETQARLGALKAAYLADTDPAAAAPLLRSLLAGALPADTHADVLLDTAALSLSHPELFDDGNFALDDALRSLDNAPLSEERQLRFIALKEQRERALGNEQAALELIASAAEQQKSPYLRAVLRLHLAHLLSAEERHAEALRTLQHLIIEQPKGELTPRARLLTARQAELIGTLPSLRAAADIYGRCAEDAAPHATRCALRRAAVLSRIGETERARAIIDDKLKQGDTLSQADRMIAYAILSNLLVQEGTPDSLQAAVHAASQMLGEPELNPRHQALSLMHHGMICTRAGKPDLALGDYLAVLRMKPAASSTLEERDYRTLRRAAAGAIYTASLLGRYEEAAKIADEAAAWPLPADKAHLRAAFTRWAQTIRKTHFVRTEEP